MSVDTVLGALRRTVTPSFVVASLALAVSLSGTAYAVATIGAKDIRDDAVRSRHLQGGAVTVADLGPAARRVQGYVEVVVGGRMAVGQRTAYVTATCPEGTVALGGGFAVFNDDIQITQSTPVDAFPRQWAVNARTYSGDPVTADSSINVRVTCAAGPAQRPVLTP